MSYLNVHFSGERRIRVHTLCLPVAANLSDILYSADQQCIVGLLAKMGKLLFFIACLFYNFTEIQHTYLFPSVQNSEEIFEILILAIQCLKACLQKF